MSQVQLQVEDIANYGHPSANFGEGLALDDFGSLPPSLVGFSFSCGSLPYNPELSYRPDDTSLQNPPGQNVSMPSASSPTFALNPAPQSAFAPSFSMASTAPDLYAPAATVPVSFAGQNTMVNSPITAGFASESQHSPVTSAFPHASTLPMAHSPAQQQNPEALSKEAQEILSAATTLHDSAHGRSHSFHGVHNAIPRSYQMVRRGMAPPPLQLRYQEIDEFRQEGRRMSQSQAMQEDGQSVIYNSMFFGQGHGGQVGARMHNGTPLANPPTLQYGTDHNFSDTNRPFVPKNDMDRFEVMEEDQKRYVDGALVPSTSNNTTRAPSPTTVGDALNNLKTRVPSKPFKTDILGGGGSRKRSATSTHDDKDPDEDPELRNDSLRASARRRKLKGGDKESPEAGPASSKAKRKKTTATKRKENLTDNQKRENHINSEKKRRTIITQGFENLNKLLPIPEGSKPSKSAVLTLTATYLEGLLNGNVQLEKQLAQLEGRSPQLLGWQDQLLAEQRQRELDAQRPRQL